MQWTGVTQVSLFPTHHQLVLVVITLRISVIVFVSDLDNNKVDLDFEGRSPIHHTFHNKY